MQNAPLDPAAGPAARPPLRELLALALPTVLQMLSYTVEQFTDIYMLSKVSNDAATAAGAAGMVSFTVLAFGFGVMMLVNARVSQSFGADRLAECGGHLWQGIWFALAYAVVTAPLMLVAAPVFRQMGHSASLVPLEVGYFNVMTAFVIVKMAAMAVGQFTLAVNRPNLVLMAAAAGMVGNIAVNWLLIYGHWGLPALGVTGAAWGTNTAMLIELLVICGFVFGPAARRRFATATVRFDIKGFLGLLRVGVPSGVQMLGDVAAWTIFFAGVMAAYGDKALAGNNYMLQYMKLSFMPAFGLGMAVTALVGRYLGAGRPDIAEARAHLGFKVAAVYMLTCGVLFVLLRHQLMNAFTDDPQIAAHGVTVLYFCAAFQLFDAVFVIYSSALRGAQDTFWPMVVQVSLNWTIVVGGGVLMARYGRWLGIGGPWTLGIIYCIILSFYLFTRFRAGRWKGAATPVPAGVFADPIAA